MKPYRCEEMSRLAHELTLSPQRLRLRQASGILRAIELIDPDREYPYSFICFHVTGYRPRRTEDTLMSGKTLTADLVQMMDALTAASPLPANAAGGRLHDADALAGRFKVSTKTISRWRKRGLAGAWYIAADGQPRFAFTGGAIERFVCRHHDLVRRGASFQLMGKREKERIITRARELVAAEKCNLHTATRRLSAETGRATETIRYTLRRFDQDHPEDALFDRAEKPREIDEATVIFEAFVAGESVRSLAERFGRCEGEIRRTLTRVRATQLAAAPVSYIYNAFFDAPDAEARILNAVVPEAGHCDDHADITLSRVPGELPAYLKALYHTPLLDREEERHLFRQMNFLLHQAELRRQSIAVDLDSVTGQDIAEIDDLLDQAAEVKNRIIQANLRLVVSIAKRHLKSYAAANLFELVSDGNLALIRAVEKFDYGRGYRFSTYASWVVARSYARSVPEEVTQITRFQTGHEETLSIARDSRESGHDAPVDIEVIRSTLSAGMDALDDRERTILERHFGLCSGGDTKTKTKTKTLEQIGGELGISKERVRQIEMRALAKLRGTLGTRGADLLAG